MSALNAILTPAAAYVWTDGSATAVDGSLAAEVDKQIVFEAARAVVAVRGGAFMIDPVRALVENSSLREVEELQRKLPDVCRVHWERWSSRALHKFETGTEILLAGWSEHSGQPEGWLMTTVAWGGKDAWTWRPLREWGRCYACPPLDEKDEWDGAAPIDAWARRAIRKQRARLFDYAPGRRGSTIGIYQRKTTVDASGVRSEIVQRWPDKIGELIRP